MGGFTDEVARRGFSIEPAKGTVEPGSTREVVVSFALKPEAIKGSELGLIASFGVSQWAEAVVTCVLKGGNPPCSAPETQILLKGFIPSMSPADMEALAAQAPAEEKKPKK